MALFVHLAPEAQVRLIRRTGIRRLRKGSAGRPGGVYAVPMTQNFYVSHQWLRELKRFHPGPMIAVQFRIPDPEQVWVGHYHRTHRSMTASEAVAEFMAAEDPLGWEVIIPRMIKPSEIHRTRRLPQVLGWRFSPEAKGKPPCCLCRYCIRGEYGSRRLRDRLATSKD